MRFSRNRHSDQERITKRYDKIHLTVQHHGETADDLLKITAFMRHYPDLSLFVQTHPAFRCACLFGEAMAARIAEYTGVPVVTLNYNGTGKNIDTNENPCITFPRRKASVKVVRRLLRSIAVRRRNRSRWLIGLINIETSAKHQY